MNPSIYLIGSLRNPKIPQLGRVLRSVGYNAFDSWFSAGPKADDHWQEYEKSKGLSFPQALDSYSAQHVFQFDQKHLQRCDMAALIMPAGKSGHLELGYATGLGKVTFIVLEQEPDRWDVMYAFAHKVFLSPVDFVEYMTRANTPSLRRTGEAYPICCGKSE